METAFGVEKSIGAAGKVHKENAMSTRAKIGAAVAAIAVLVVAFRGTAQAQPTNSSIPNSNFRSGTSLLPAAPLTCWAGPYNHYTSMPDGMMSPYNNEGPSGGFDLGYASNWYIGEDPQQAMMAVWNPTTTYGASQTYPTGYWVGSPAGSNPVTTISGPVTPATLDFGGSYGGVQPQTPNYIINPPPPAPPPPGPSLWHFNYSNGNGVLPGTAAGSQCLANIAYLDPNADELDGSIVPGIDNQTTGDPNTGTTVSSSAKTITTLTAHKRYIETIAVASPLGATYNAGNNLAVYDLNTSARAVNENMYPKGQTANGGCVW